MKKPSFIIAPFLAFAAAISMADGQTATNAPNIVAHDASFTAFVEVYRRGGVIAGSSAGATVQGSYLVRGAPEGNEIMMAEGHEEGFGFLPDAAIDQHAIARKRLDDMIPVIERHPHLLGIAIDEGAALRVSGGVASVLGKSKVALYDAKRWEKGAPKYFFLEKGQRFEMATRRLMP